MISEQVTYPPSIRSFCAAFACPDAESPSSAPLEASSLPSISTIPQDRPSHFFPAHRISRWHIYHRHVMRGGGAVPSLAPTLPRQCRINPSFHDLSHFSAASLPQDAPPPFPLPSLLRWVSPRVIREHLKRVRMEHGSRLVDILGFHQPPPSIAHTWLAPQRLEKGGEQEDEPNVSMEDGWMHQLRLVLPLIARCYPLASDCSVLLAT